MQGRCPRPFNVRGFLGFGYKLCPGGYVSFRDEDNELHFEEYMSELQYRICVDLGNREQLRLGAALNPGHAFN